MRRERELKAFFTRFKRSVDNDTRIHGETIALRILRRVNITDKERVEILAEVTGKRVTVRNFHQYARRAESRKS